MISSVAVSIQKKNDKKKQIVSIFDENKNRIISETKKNETNADLVLESDVEENVKQRRLV